MSATPREELPVLYQDENLIAVHKPNGLLVHRTSLDFYETRFALQIVRDQIGQRVYPVHRLDKGTSGVLLFALNEDAGRHVSRQFEVQHVHKRYLAIVRGHPETEGVIDHPLVRRPDEVEFVDPRAEQAPQQAVTAYRRLATVELPHTVDRYPTSRYALLALEPHTGRRHQLRRHLKHIAHPIIGDATYGKERHNRLFQQLFGIQRMFLACLSMDLRHPETDEPLHIRAPIAEDFQHVLQEIGWGNVSLF
jgi:tRNA pseudouridine65 synthase